MLHETSTCVVLFKSWCMGSQQLRYAKTTECNGQQHGDKHHSGKTYRRLHLESMATRVQLARQCGLHLQKVTSANSPLFAPEGRGKGSGAASRLCIHLLEKVLHQLEMGMTVMTAA